MKAPIPTLMLIALVVILTTTTARQNPETNINKRFEAIETSMEKMRQELREKDEKIANLEASMKTINFLYDVTDIPYGIWCGYNSGMWFDDFSTITFQTKSFPNDFLEETNLPETGGLDRTSGVFKAPVSGTFVISVGFTSAHSFFDSLRSYNQLILRRNGVNMGRSSMYDYYIFKNEDDAYFASDMESRGGVTTIEQLQEGDLVTLETMNLDGYLVDINICFQLINGWKNMN